MFYKHLLYYLHFFFRPAWYITPDLQYGSLNASGHWTGLIGEVTYGVRNHKQLICMHSVVLISYLARYYKLEDHKDCIHLCWYTGCFVKYHFTCQTACRLT